MEYQDGVAHGSFPTLLQSSADIRSALRALLKTVCGTLRELLATHKDLARKLDALEKKYDQQFQIVFEAIRSLLKPSVPPKRQIGFRVEEPKALCALRRKALRKKH